VARKWPRFAASLILKKFAEILELPFYFIYFLQSECEAQTFWGWEKKVANLFSVSLSIAKRAESSWKAASNRAICRPFVWSFKLNHQIRFLSNSTCTWFVLRKKERVKKNEFELNFSSVNIWTVFFSLKIFFSEKNWKKWPRKRSRKSRRKNDQLRICLGRERILCMRYDLQAALLITG